MSTPFRRPRVPAGTAPFDWPMWRAINFRHTTSGWPSRERWQLAYLHSARTLDSMAKAALRGFSAASRPVALSVQSVWIDGTPQVTGSLPDGSALAQCELADLLLIVNQVDPGGMTVRRTGLLIQGKTTKRHSKLPSNASTKKERQLLECLRRSAPLHVYRDTGLASQIGSYIFGGGHGLQDCARYLMMAKSWAWGCPCRICQGRLPLQFGWPPARTSSSMAPTTDFVLGLQQLAVTGTLGRTIHDKGSPSFCEWSRLVWDLLGDYQPVVMSGYGGQNRVNVSRTMSFLSAASSWGSPSTSVFPDGVALPRQPSISVLQVNVWSHNWDFGPERNMNDRKVGQ
jgi:hypothetical protein